MPYRVTGVSDFVALAAAEQRAELAGILEHLRGPVLGDADGTLAARRRAVGLLPEGAALTLIADTVFSAVLAFAESVPPAVALDGLGTLARITFSEPLLQGTPSRAQQAENARALAALVHQAAAAALAVPVATWPLSVYEDIAVVRAQVIAILDRLDDEADDACFEALATLRAQLIAALTARGATLKPLAPYATASPRSSLTLAHRLYQDASRASELVARTHAPHPGFLPEAGLVASA